MQNRPTAYRVTSVLLLPLLTVALCTHLVNVIEVENYGIGNRNSLKVDTPVVPEMSSAEPSRCADILCNVKYNFTEYLVR
jgi:hypothetical protein